MTLLLLALARAAGAAEAARADDPQTVARLDTLVVTGTRSEKNLLDTPVRTEVVSRAEMARTQARTLKQALENVPGLLITEVHGKPGYEVSMQGLSSDQVLVLIDGLPISASTGSTVDLSQYLIGGVDHIEVVKGASSAQYGSAAMGGVINVITRRLAPGLNGQVALDLGSHGNQNPSGAAWQPALGHARAQLEGGSEAWRFRLNGDALRDDGFTTDPSAWARQGAKIERSQWGARGQWQPQANAGLWLDGSHYRENSEQRFDFFAPPNLIPRSNREDVTRNRIGYGGHWRGDSGVRAQVQGVSERYHSEVGEFSNAALTQARDAHLGTDHLTAQVDLPPWLRQSWQLGTTFNRETLTQSVNGASELDGARATRHSDEVFVQNDVMLSERWELLLGARWQNDSDFGAHSVPKLGLRWSWLDQGEWSGLLRASVGQGYRVPNLKERHFRFDHSSLGYVVIGNPALRPESSTSVQLGAQLARSERGSLDLNLFANRVRDLIQVDEARAPVVNGITQFSYANLSRARTQGLEAAALWHLSPGLDLRAGYTFLDSENRDTGTQLTRRPRHSGRIGADWWVRADTELALRLRLQSDELISTNPNSQLVDGRSPGWVTLDATVNYHWRPQTTLFAAVTNALDRQRDFADANDFSPETGRLIRLGLRHDFGAAREPI